MTNNNNEQADKQSQATTCVASRQPHTMDGTSTRWYADGHVEYGYSTDLSNAGGRWCVIRVGVVSVMVNAGVDPNKPSKRYVHDANINMRVRTLQKVLEAYAPSMLSVMTCAPMVIEQETGRFLVYSKNDIVPDEEGGALSSAYTQIDGCVSILTAWYGGALSAAVSAEKTEMVKHHKAVAQMLLGTEDAEDTQEEVDRSAYWVTRFRTEQVEIKKRIYAETGIQI